MGDAKRGKKTKRNDEAELDERGYLLHINDLKLSYRKTYWILRRALRGCGTEGKHPDEKLLKEAISDIHYAITWMHTGRRPGNRRGIERRAAYQREKLMDPLRMQAFMSRSTTGSPSNITDWQRFQIEDALSRLSPRERECYELAHGQGFSFGYIANMLGISKGTVEEYVNRAQRKVSEDLQSSLFLISAGKEGC